MQAQKWILIVNIIEEDDDKIYKTSQYWGFSGNGMGFVKVTAHGPSELRLMLQDQISKILWAPV